MVSNVNRISWVLVGLLLMVLGVNSLWIVRNYAISEAEVAANFRRAAEVLRTNKEIPILFDHWRTSIRFGYYLDFKEGSHLYEGADESVRMDRDRAEKGTRLGYLKWYKNPEDLPEALVVLQDQILAEAKDAAAGDPTRSSYPAKDIPAYCQVPPASWDFVGRFGSVRLFKTHKASVAQ